jgi:hypothetical protein
MPSGEKIKHYRVSGAFFHEIEPLVKSVAAE